MSFLQGLVLFLLFIFLFIIIFGFATRKYRNPYSLVFVFGKKGSGKSTYLARIAVKHLKKGWDIYTNCDDLMIPGVRHINIEDLGKFIPTANSVLLLDEVGMVWDSRNFKSFKPEVRDFFKLQRHYRVKCYLASQTFDVDKKLRDLTDDMLLCTKVANIFSFAHHISKKFVLTEAQGDSESRIAENLQFSKKFFIFPYITITFIPKYACFFNSYTTPNLPTLRYQQDQLDDLDSKSQRQYKKMFKKQLKKWSKPIK